MLHQTEVRCNGNILWALDRKHSSFFSLCGDVGCMLNYFVPFFVDYLHFFLCCVNANQVPPGAYTNKHIRLTLFLGCSSCVGSAGIL